MYDNEDCIIDFFDYQKELKKLAEELKNLDKQK